MNNINKQVKEVDILEGITPGKWTISDTGTVGNFIVHARPIPDDGGDIICQAPERWKSSMKRWTANARLIASAPQLAAENKRLKEYIKILKTQSDRKIELFESTNIENKKIKEVNKLLVDALNDVIMAEDNKSKIAEIMEMNYLTPNWFDKAQAALKEANLIK